jgi:hypothetical protein
MQPEGAIPAAQASSRLQPIPCVDRATLREPTRLAPPPGQRAGRGVLRRRRSDEAVAMANGTEHGLVAYVCTALPSLPTARPRGE